MVPQSLDGLSAGIRPYAKRGADRSQAADAPVPAMWVVLPYLTFTASVEEAEGFMNFEPAKVSLKW